MSLLTFAIDKMSEATQFYSVGEYDKALEIYNSLIDEDLSSVALFYNAGNTNFKLGNIGKSILCYERALVLDPNNEDVKYNLELAQSKVTDNIEVIKPFIFTRIYNSIIETKRKMLYTYYPHDKFPYFVEKILGINAFRSIQHNCDFCETFMCFTVDEFLRIPLI